MTADLENLITERYKGMEIRIRAYMGEYDTWRCYIHVCTATQCTRKTLQATVRATAGSLTRSAAMALAFIEALGLCDALLEENAVTGDVL